MTSVQTFSAVEPIAGVCLAISLAYLNLERFRYRKKIRAIAAAKIESLRGNKLIGLVSGLSQYRALASMSELPDNTPAEVRRNGRKKADNGNVYSPSLLLYNVVFSHHVDRSATIFSAALAMTALFLGVLQNLNGTQWLEPILTPLIATLAAYILLAGSCLPVGMIILGNTLVDKLDQFAEGLCRELETVMASEAERAQPNIPTQPPPVT